MLLWNVPLEDGEKRRIAALGVPRRVHMKRDADVLGVNVAQGDVQLEVERVVVVPHRVLAIRDEEVGVQRLGEEI